MKVYISLIGDVLHAGHVKDLSKKALNMVK